MREHSLAAFVAAFSVVLVAAPARAQNFQNGSAETVWEGSFRLTGSPVQMFGTEGRPDRTGGAFRLGYGITESIDIEAKSAFFDGFSLVGGDGHFTLMCCDTSLSVSVGGHRALVTAGPDSNALDLAVRLGRRVGRRLELYAAPAFSYESVSGVKDSGFTRWYLVPGLKLAIGDRLQLLAEGGVGFNVESPSYITAGFAVNVPASAGAHGPRR